MFQFYIVRYVAEVCDSIKQALVCEILEKCCRWSIRRGSSTAGLYDV